MKTLTQIVGECLKNIRLQKGFTQEQVELEFGLARQNAISRIENANWNFSFKQIEPLLKFYGYTIFFIPTNMKKTFLEFTESDQDVFAQHLANIFKLEAKKVLMFLKEKNYTYTFSEVLGWQLEEKANQEFATFFKIFG